MSEPISLYRKFTGTAGVMIISRCLAMILGIIYARFLGPEQFGLYSFALSIIAMATLPAVAGLPNLLVREIAHFHLQEKWGLLKGVINWSRLYVVSISLIVMLIMSGALYFNFFESSVSDLLWVAIFLIPIKGLLIQQGAIFNGFRKPIFAQLPIQIFAPLMTLVVLSCYIFFYSELSAYHLLYISLLSAFSAFIISAFLIRKKLLVTLKDATTDYITKTWHKALLPFTLIAFIGALNTELASVFLGFLGDIESVAYFKVAMQGVALISLSLSAINMVIMPNVARLYKEGDLEATQMLLTKSVRLSCLVSLPIIFILVFFGDFLINLLFGSEYLKAYSILLVLCIGQTVNVLMGSVGLILNMTGNEMNGIKPFLFALILNLVFLLSFIPHYGVIGAAIAVSISTIFWNVYMAWEAFKVTGIKTWII
ncbi:flippase [Psychromonas sp. B3M02]|uniref:flippase n=1 Tax=Psychromonas sp. B3M02 TaxID=2267226 RepID=UPI00215D7A9F|nr:flippase [Psychromonas sp. B3M02]